MTSQKTFVRKIMYGVAIGVLLLPLYVLSHPATNAVKGVPGSPGGKLAQLRDQYGLSQAKLGQIDPTSVTIKLATLGMRGFASVILWHDANEYFLQADWTNYGAALAQITKLQPHFVNVWGNRAWNVSYNISVQFDDFRERYRWVVKGFDFLKEGIQYNEQQPRLPWDLGWMISQKIGRSDEKKQFRKLFKEDDDFHQSRPLALRDNWLVGKKEFERTLEMVDRLGVGVIGKGPLIYRSSGPMCQINYSDALETDGTFGEVAKRAWATAAEEWHRYGDTDIPTSYHDVFTNEPITIHLNDRELQLETARKLVAELDAMQPGLREKLIAKKRDALSLSQREALDTPADKRTGRQNELAQQASEAIQVSHDDVARSITGPKRKEAVQIAKEIVRNEVAAERLDVQRDIVNFEYWRMRVEAEQTEDTLNARKLVFQGDRAYTENDLMAARDAYERGLVCWRKVLDKYPTMGSEIAAGDDLMKMCRRYRRILSQLDEPFPEKFILQDLVDSLDHNNIVQAKRASQLQRANPQQELGGSTPPPATGKGPE
jgi:hypothetical protein